MKNLRNSPVNCLGERSSESFEMNFEMESIEDDEKGADNE